MTDNEIKALAIASGFTPREQSPGRVDLNPYVYDFAKQLIAAEREACIKLATEYARHYMGVSVWPLVDILRARSDK